MRLPLWMGWVFVGVGYVTMLGGAVWLAATLWWEGIDLWLRWHKMRSDFVEAYFEVRRKKDKQGQH